ncbi:MAG TPA: valine--tRNA ligase [Chitinophagaceae bacterium]|nr:valine--tRNA ligase [Chitinophagaceae bacterium]
MELSKNYNPSGVDDKWYNHWVGSGYFASKPDHRESYTIVIPPPNVTGVLHMGHCLNNTIQDILVRRARMQGKNACWVPGTDHASIATEAKVVGMLREKGISKSSLSRDEFLQYAWEWKEKYGGIILQQLRRLGCSLDWDRTTFTMDPHYYRSVMEVFVDLYNKGHIYRGKRMIHWDPKAKTALSDEEVIYREVNSKLYHLKYFLEDANGNGQSKEYITIATVRPETILGDTAICVHPNDERYRHLHGRHAFVPLINRRIPVILDEYVTMEFGTGALKVTPAHDMNDYQLGQKHGLEAIDILTEDGRLNEAAQLYVGEDRFEARKKIAKELEEKGHLVKTEDYTNQLGFSERTEAVVEPRLSLQWWVSMKKISEPALRAVMEDDIKFYPVKFKNMYRAWMENIRDWCISRQLWWGHRVPAWYAPDGSFEVAETKEKAYEQFKRKGATFSIDALQQDEDCLDTWFSSWLWPIEVFRGISEPGNKDIQYYYPTNTLVTAPEIIFFWVARMIMAGFEYKDHKPFTEVYFTGIVRDKLGRKMSKQLGNSPDLLGLIDQYGADAVRFGIMIASPAGNDLLFDDSSLEQGRNFNNKLWNAMKLVRMWNEKLGQENSNGNSGSTANANAAFAVAWFENKLNDTRADLEQMFKEFRLSEALKTIYSLTWDDFCSWYLEWVKPAPGEWMNMAVYEKTIQFFEQLLQLLHPFMPFITEEIYHLLKERKPGDDICIRPYDAVVPADKKILEEGELLKQVITAIRDARVKNNLKSKETIQLHIQTANETSFKAVESILLKQVNADNLSFTRDAVANTIPVVTGKDKFYLQTATAIDSSSHKEQLVKDLEYLKGFLISVDKKLGNEKFVQNAKPEVVALEQKKRADAEAKIKAIEESLAGL